MGGSPSRLSGGCTYLFAGTERTVKIDVARLTFKQAKRLIAIYNEQHGTHYDFQPECSWYCLTFPIVGCSDNKGTLARGTLRECFAAIDVY